MEKITYALTIGGPQPTSYLAVVLGLGLTRTREILASLVKDGVIEPIGVGRGRKYRLAGQYRLMTAFGSLDLTWIEPNSSGSPSQRFQGETGRAERGVSRYSGHDISCVRIAYPKHDTRTISGSSMSQGFAPFYDVNRTYEDNYLQGPFGAFAEVMKDDSAAGASARSAQTTGRSSDQAEFLGFRDEPAVWHSRWSAAERAVHHRRLSMGFDLAVYKTVRSRAWGSTPSRTCSPCIEERRRVAGSRQRRTAG